MLETIARSALCLRCTNCWRQYCTADFISDLIKSKQKIRQGSDVHIRQWIIWRRTEWLNKDVMSVESKGGLLQSTSWRRLIPITHNSIWDALKSCGIEHDYIHLLKRLFKNQKDTVMIDEESMFEIKKGSKQGDPLSSLVFNTVLQMALKDNLPRWQKKRGLGICLGDNDHDCFTNMRFADGVLLFASSEEQLQNMLCDFKRSTAKVGLRIHPGKTIILSNESSNIRKKVRLKTSMSIY